MITQQEVLDNFRYNPETGELWRRLKTKSKLISAKSSSGYFELTFKKKVYLAHRIIWLMIYGYMPIGTDHINRIKTDNRLCNLREANQKENGANHSMNVNNTSGYKGVMWRKKANKWESSIMYNYRNIYLGLFNNIEDANNAYIKASKKYFGDFANNIKK
jgi:hypothetical protein